MMTERVLIQGASSPVGRRLLEALRDVPATSVGTADRLDRAALRAALREAHVVINAVMGSAAAIRAAAARLYAAREGAAPMRLVHLSSMSVYGEATGLCDEATPPTGRISAYGAAHVAAEAEARRFAPAVILRPGCEYGPDCIPWSGRVASWLINGRLGDLGAGGDGCCNLVFIDDLVRAVRAAMRAPQAALDRAFNIAMAQPPTWNEYLIAFAIALRTTPVRRMTRRRLALETRVLAPPLKLAELTLGRIPAVRARLPPPIPPSFRRLCTQELRLDVTAAELLLGLEWTPLEAGLAAAARAWQRRARPAGRRRARGALAMPEGSSISSRETD